MSLVLRIGLCRLHRARLLVRASKSTEHFTFPIIPPRPPPSYTPHTPSQSTTNTVTMPNQYRGLRT